MDQLKCLICCIIKSIKFYSHKFLCLFTFFHKSDESFVFLATVNLLAVGTNMQLSELNIASAQLSRTDNTLLQHFPQLAAMTGSSVEHQSIENSGYFFHFGYRNNLISRNIKVSPHQNSGILRSVIWRFVTDVTGQPSGTVFFFVCRPLRQH